MFERFTGEARQVIVLAQDEARKLKHNYIGTEHLLLGVARVRSGEAGAALDACGLTEDRLRERVISIVGPGEEPARGQIPFTPRATKALELANRESGGWEVRPAHLLLGLIHDADGIALRVIVEQGVKPARLRNEIATALAREGPPGDVAHRVPLGEQSGFAYGTTVSSAPINPELETALTLIYRCAALISLICTGLVATAALVAVAVLEGTTGSHTAVEAGILAASAWVPAVCLVALVSLRYEVTEDERRPVVALGAEGLALSIAGIAVNASALTIALGTSASAMAIALAAYSLKPPPG